MLFIKKKTINHDILCSHFLSSIGEEVGVFFCLCTHFYFSLPTEKFLRGQGEKYTRAEKGIDNYHLTEIYIAYSLSTNDLFTTRISDR